jgi:hypothetical protein
LPRPKVAVYLSQPNFSFLPPPSQTQSDKRKIEETRAGLGRNNMEDYIAEHQEFIAEQETRNPPPAPEE